MITAATAHLLNANLFASDVGLVGARMVRIVWLQLLSHAVGTVSRTLAGFLFDVNLLLDQQYVRRLGGEVSEQCGLVTRTLHIHPNVTTTDVNLSGNLERPAVAASRIDVQVGGKGIELRNLSRG